MTCMRSDSISLIYSICRLDRVGCAVPCRLLSWGENWFNISKYLSFAINKKEIFRYRSCLYQQIGNNLWCAKTKKGLRIKIIMTANQLYTNFLINLICWNEWMKITNQHRWMKNLFAYKNACSNNQTMLWSFELSFCYS